MEDGVVGGVVVVDNLFAGSVTADSVQLVVDGCDRCKRIRERKKT